MKKSSTSRTTWSPSEDEVVLNLFKCNPSVKQREVFDKASKILERTSSAVRFRFAHHLREQPEFQELLGPTRTRPVKNTTASHKKQNSELYELTSKLFKKLSTNEKLAIIEAAF